jgi:ferritin-like metal-binding protein YciE
MEPKDLVLQYLDDAHAIETALVTNLIAHRTMTTDPRPRKLLERHLAETRQQVKNIERRRTQLGGKDGRGLVAGALGLVQDAVGQALVLTKGPIDLVRTVNQAERQLKNARDECATEALEIATYDYLEAAAKAADDAVTARLAADHRSEEERMLRDLRALLPKLALAAVEDQTTIENATLTLPRSRSRSTTTRRSTSGRATSGGSRSTASTRKKASGAKRSTSSSSRSTSSSSSRPKSAATGRSNSSRTTGSAKSGSSKRSTGTAKRSTTTRKKSS